MKSGTHWLLLAFFALGCTKSDPSSEAQRGDVPKSSATPEVAPEFIANPPEGPVGAISVRVVLNGMAPQMPKLRRGSDPICAQKEAFAETVVVGEGGGLANVVVRLAKGSAPSWLKTPYVEINQTECTYRPRVQGAVTGQTLRISNNDDTLHNVHAFHQELGTRRATDTIANRAQPPKRSAMEIPVLKQDIIKFKCDIHGWMQAFVVVSDHPYFATTADTGAARIEAVPVGTHKIETWHELYGIKAVEVTVAEGEVASVTIEYDAAGDNPYGTDESGTNKGSAKGSK